MDLLGIRQTDRQTGCPKLSCADPSLSGNELERAASTCLPEDNTLTPRAISEVQRLVSGYRQSSWLQQLHLLLLLLAGQRGAQGSAHAALGDPGLLSLPARGAPSEQSRAGLTDRELGCLTRGESLVWMRHGHVRVPGPVFRRHQPVQLHQLPGAD